MPDDAADVADATADATNGADATDGEVGKPATAVEGGIPTEASTSTSAAASTPAAPTPPQEGDRVFSVAQHRSYILVAQLKALKGTDASNMFDEEPGSDEEFSDDEKV